MLEKANKELWDLELEVYALDEIVCTEAIEISTKNNLTVYDALYVALARFHGAPLITADKELFTLPNVIPLKNT